LEVQVLTSGGSLSNASGACKYQEQATWSNFHAAALMALISVCEHPSSLQRVRQQPARSMFLQKSLLSEKAAV
jgi:hypothetical protein